jgi:hypothetical protein
LPNDEAPAGITTDDDVPDGAGAGDGEGDGVGVAGDDEEPLPHAAASSRIPKTATSCNLNIKSSRPETSGQSSGQRLFEHDCHVGCPRTSEVESAAAGELFPRDSVNQV